MKTLYHKECWDSTGKFSEMKQGKSKSVFCDWWESPPWGIHGYPREFTQKGDANMAAGSFCWWVNDWLFPSHNRYLMSFLNQFYYKQPHLGFIVMPFDRPDNKKGTYVTRREHKHIVTHRKEFLEEIREMQTTLLHLTLESAPHPSLMLRQGRNSYYIMTRVFSTQIRARVGCGLVKTQPIILPKRKGLGIMIASFEEYGRFSFFLMMDMKLVFR